jgi:hypothetical protein
MYELGLIATLIGIVGAIPYIYNTYRRKTKPHRVAWIIFLILSLISFTSQFSLGARASLFFFGWFVVNNLILVTLSLRKNGGYGDISLLNIFCFILAVLSIILWKTTNSPLIALICVLIADGIGALLILVKSFKQPYTETIFMWYLGSVAGFLNVIAVGKLDITLLAAPFQLFLFNVAIVIAILLGKNTKPKRNRITPPKFTRPS